MFVYNRISSFCPFRISHIILLYTVSLQTFVLQCMVGLLTWINSIAIRLKKAGSLELRLTCSPMSPTVSSDLLKICWKTFNIKDLKTYLILVNVLLLLLFGWGAVSILPPQPFRIAVFPVIITNIYLFSASLHDKISARINWSRSDGTMCFPLPDRPSRDVRTRDRRPGILMLYPASYSGEQTYLPVELRKPPFKQHVYHRIYFCRLNARFTYVVHACTVYI